MKIDTCSKYPTRQTIETAVNQTLSVDCNPTLFIKKTEDTLNRVGNLGKIE